MKKLALVFFIVGIIGIIIPMFFSPPENKTETTKQMSAQPEAEDLPEGAYECSKLVAPPDGWVSVKVPPHTKILWDENAPVKERYLWRGKTHWYQGGRPNMKKVYFQSRKRGEVTVRFCFYKH